MNSALHRSAATLVALLCCASSLHAQVPQLISYQGRVAVNGTNFNGTGQFKFALVNAAGSTTFWSNGVNNVSLSVSNGLYSVLLGDTTIPNMSFAIPSTVFNNTDVRLRVQFNDGTTGLQTLSPDQRIAAVGYAMIAATVPDGAITSAKIAAGAVGTTQLANGAVASAKLATDAVTTTSILNGTVTDADIATNAAINASKIVGGDLMAQRLKVGVNHTLTGGLATIAGGSNNVANAQFAAIGGGQGNTIQPDAFAATLGGGEGNVIESNAEHATIGGGDGNMIQSNSSGATIGGGQANAIQAATFATIGGGIANTIQASGDYVTIGGGTGNRIELDADYSTIGGGFGNAIQGHTAAATIGGGRANRIATNALNTTIGGGFGNTIQDQSAAATIGGGVNNVISTNASYGTIPGGNANMIGPNASYAFAAGFAARALHPGAFVWADSTGAILSSTANNQFLIRATGGVGIGTTSPGARLEVRTTDASGNAIRFGHTTGAGNLIAGISRVSIATDDLVERLSIRQTGNVGIGLTGPNFLLHLAADSAGKPNGGSWANSSDARVKKNIQPLRGALDQLTQLRGVSFEWVHPADHANQTGRQVGFVAQEVERVFPHWIQEVPGAEDDASLTPDGRIKSLSLPFEFDALTVEALRELRAEKDAAIQTLNQKLTEALKLRDAENAELKQRLERLEQLMAEMNGDRR